MAGKAQNDPLLRGRVRDFALSLKGQTGAINTLTLVIILVAPLIIMGAVALVIIMAYVRRMSRIITEADTKAKPTVCPACGHRLVEILNFCAECGASIWPPETKPADWTDAGPEEPE